MSFPTEKLMKESNLFWQYPVITEKTFYEQNKSKETFLGFPWATIIDKHYDLKMIMRLLKPYIKVNSKYYTCCQHILFKKLWPLFKDLQINVVFSSHKTIHENIVNNITLKPCPLYAVNVEDHTRNFIFQNIDYYTTERPYLYSFQGAYDPKWYISDIRKQIYEMTHPKNCIVKSTEQWHFEKVVYTTFQNVHTQLNETKEDTIRTSLYNSMLIKSRYSLCPSGSGPNSIRFWESLAVGSIPILLADTLDLPEHVLWNDAILRIKESELYNLPTILSNITVEEEDIKRKNCIQIYNHFKNNFANESEYS